MSLSVALTSCLMLALGVLLGVVHFATLRRIADQFAEGRVLAAAALQLGRLVLLGVALFIAARLGVWPLLSCAAGMLVGRRIVLRRNRTAR